MTDPKRARYDELIRGGMSSSEAIHMTDAEFGEGHYQPTQSEKYKKEFGRKETKSAEKEYIRPRIFESSKDADEYLRSLPEKERYEMESRLKGFKSGEERRRAIEHINIEKFKSGDIKTAKEMYGTPEEKYEKIREKGKEIYGTVKSSAAEAIATLKSRKLMKEKFVQAGKVAIGATALALEKRHPDDIRNIKKIRKELEKQDAIERKRIIEEKHQKKLEEIAAAGGVLTPNQRLALEKFRIKYKYGKKQIPAPRQTLEKRMSAGGFVGGFSFGGTSSAQKISGNPFGLGETGITGHRPERRPQRPQRADEALGLNSFGFSSSGNPFGLNAGGVSNTTKKNKKSKSKSNDPLGLGGFF